jgi:hypothetical protein
MRSSPSVVPSFDVTVYIVLDDFGELGRAYLETDEAHADRETGVSNILGGEYRKPFRVVAFNTAESWSRDMSEDVAWEVLTRASESNTTLPFSAYSFCVDHVGERAVYLHQNALSVARTSTFQMRAHIIRQSTASGAPPSIGCA